MSNIRLSDTGEERVQAIKALGSPYNLMSKQAIVEHALKVLVDDTERPITLSEIRDLISAYQNGVLDKLALNVSNDEPRRSPGRPRKGTDEASAPSKPDGASICVLLDGLNDGSMCMYKKREIMVTGKAVEYEVGFSLEAMTMDMVDKQYDPSREKWEEAKRKQEQTA